MDLRFILKLGLFLIFAKGLRANEGQTVSQTVATVAEVIEQSFLKVFKRLEKKLNAITDEINDFKIQLNQSNNNIREMSKEILKIKECCVNNTANNNKNNNCNNKNNDNNNNIDRINKKIATQLNSEILSKMAAINETLSTIKDVCFPSTNYSSALSTTQDAITPLPKCTPGTFHHNNSCISLHMEVATWTEALEHCLFTGGSLAEIKTQNYTLVEALQSHYPELSRKKDWIIWLGATDKDEEGHWEWLLGGDLDPLDPRWTPGLPSRVFDNDCLAVHVKMESKKWAFRDARCHVKTQFLCQYPL